MGRTQGREKQDRLLEKNESGKAERKAMGINRQLHELCQPAKKKQTAEQIRKAEECLRLSTRQLIRKYPLFAPFRELLRPTPVVERTFLETDGERLFYQPEYLLGFYEGRQFSMVEKRLMHLYLHGILGHFSRRELYEDNRLIDSIMDYQAWYIEYRLEGRPEIFLPIGVRDLIYGWGEKLTEMSLGEIYRQAKLEKPLEQALYKAQCGSGFGVDDDHGFWNLPQVFIQVQKVRVSKKWTDWSEKMFGGEGRNLEAVAGLLAEEKGDYGTAGGQREEKVEGAGPAKRTYLELLKEFIKNKESGKESMDWFDRNLYCHGMQTYGNVALLEPEEDREQKMLKTLYIALDTSGSCSGQIMERFVRELRGMLLEVSGEITFENMILLQCDAKIHNEKRFQWADQLQLEEQYPVFGFGGTSFQPVFTRIEQLRREENLEPDCLIYFTDGCGEYPEQAPEYPVIFIEEKACDMAPGWVRQILIDK